MSNQGDFQENDKYWIGGTGFETGNRYIFGAAFLANVKALAGFMKSYCSKVSITKLSVWPHRKA